MKTILNVIELIQDGAQHIAFSQNILKVKQDMKNRHQEKPVRRNHMFSGVYFTI